MIYNFVAATLPLLVIAVSITAIIRIVRLINREKKS